MTSLLRLIIVHSRGTNQDNIAPINKIETCGNENHPISGEMFESNIENQSNKIEHQSSYWVNQNNGCIQQARIQGGGTHRPPLKLEKI